MNYELLNPKDVFLFFGEINKIPRPSKHEEKMISFLQDFGKQRGHQAQYQRCSQSDKDELVDVTPNGLEVDVGNAQSYQEAAC